MTNARVTIPQYAKNSSHSRSWARSVAVEVALENRAIGRRIAQLREQARLTQPVAADKVGVSLRGYQKWEAGTRPGWDNLEKLAKVFGVKVEDIIGRPLPAEERVVLTTADVERLKRIEEKMDEILERLRRLDEDDQEPEIPDEYEPDQETEQEPPDDAADERAAS